MPGRSGDHAARADKAKVSRAEQSAAKDALRVVAAQAKADAAAERMAAAEALKLAKAQAKAEKKVADADALKLVKAQAKAAKVAAADALKLLKAQAAAEVAAKKKADANALKLLKAQAKLLLRRLRLMPRQIGKSPGALKVATAQPRADVPTEIEATIAVCGDEATGGFNEELPVPF